MGSYAHRSMQHDLMHLSEARIDTLLLCGSNKVRIIISTYVNILGVRGISNFIRAGEHGMSSHAHESMQHDLLQPSEAAIDAILW